MGDSLVIECMATTHVAVNVSLLNFYWMEPGEDNIMNSGSNRIAIQSTTAQGNTYVSRLQFDYLVVTDEGDYNCTVEFFDAVESVIVHMDRPDCECNVFYITVYV